MAASKTQKGKRKTTTRNTNKKNAAKQSVSSGFQTEIILLIILAASVILLFSNFGMGGFAGNAISSFAFGAVGLLAYIFPVLLFLGSAFLLSNRQNSLAYKKFFAGVVFFFFCADSFSF